MSFTARVGSRIKSTISSKRGRGESPDQAFAKPFAQTTTPDLPAPSLSRKPFVDAGVEQPCLLTGSTGGYRFFDTNIDHGPLLMIPGARLRPSARSMVLGRVRSRYVVCAVIVGTVVRVSDGKVGEADLRSLAKRR